jgi:hypothetical protein
MVVSVSRRRAILPADLSAFRLLVWIHLDQQRGGTERMHTAGQNHLAWALLSSSNPAAPSHLVSPNSEQTYLFADALGEISSPSAHQHAPRHHQRY